MDGKGRRKFGESVSLAYSSLFTSSVLIHQHSKLKIAGTKKTWYHHLLRSYRCPNPIVLFPPALRRFTLSVQLHYILLFCCSVATVVQQLCMTLAKEFKFVEDVTSNLFYDSEYFVVQNVILAMKSNADDDSLPASHNRVMFTTVEALNTHLATRSYVTGYSLSEDDKAALAALKASPSSSAQPHAYRWALHISALTGKSVAQASAPATSVSASVSTDDISSPRAISRATSTDVINSNSVFSGDDDVDEDEDDDEDTDFEKLPPSRKRLHSMYSISSSSFKNLAHSPGRQAVTRKSSFIWQNNPVYSLSVTVADTKVRNTIYSISLSSLSIANGSILNEGNDNQNIVYSSPSKPKLQSSSSTSTSTSTSSLSIECPVITAKANICSPKRVPILTYSDLTVYNPIYFSSLTSAEAVAYNSNDSSPLASARVMVYRQ